MCVPYLWVMLIYTISINDCAISKNKRIPHKFKAMECKKQTQWHSAVKFHNKNRKFEINFMTEIRSIYVGERLSYIWIVNIDKYIYISIFGCWIPMSMKDVPQIYDV